MISGSRKNISYQYVFGNMKLRREDLALDSCESGILKDLVLVAGLQQGLGRRG